MNKKMVKIIKNLAAIGVMVERLAEMHEGIQVLENDIADIKCAIARQGEELDLLYQQHCQATSVIHGRRASDKH